MDPTDGRPSDPRSTGGPTVAARATTILAYAVALAGAGGATLALRAGDLAGALIVLTTTLAVAATLVGVGTLLRELERVTVRLTAIEGRIARGEHT